MKKTNILLFFIFSILNYFPPYCKTFSCSGKFPNKISDCTNLSTLAYNCCFLQGTSITSSFLIYKLCYGFKAGKDPSEYSQPNLSPQININVMECGSLQNKIKKSDLCGIDSPKNSSVCYSFSSNCCFLTYQGYTFCLDKNKFDWRASGVELICYSTFLIGLKKKLTWILIYLIILII
jgi:hypothetical protein